MRKIILIIAVSAIMAGCKDSRPSQPAEGMDADSLALENMDSQDNDPLPLHEETCSPSTMGKVVAAHYADLSFETALPIQQVLVKNGQQVRRGQTLAVLDQYKLRNAIEQQQRAIEHAQLQIEQAQLQMQDVIISQGYDPDKTTSIPLDVRHNADVKSGYALANNQLATARTQLAAAQHELRSGVLAAPFDGVVANLSVQAHQLAQPGQTVCRVIATDDMEVEFRVMEADLSKYQIGTVVGVVPVADPGTRYEATVTEINPVVDEQGAVTLRAKLSDAQKLFDGMNVEVMQEVKKH